MILRVSPFWSLLLAVNTLPATVSAQVHAAPACPPPAKAGPRIDQWTVSYSPDHTLSIRVPPGYRKDPTYPDSSGGRWTASHGRSFMLSQQDLRAERLEMFREWELDTAAAQTSERGMELYWLPEGNAFGARDGYQVLDGYEVVEHSACRESVGGVPVLIEAALVSGGSEARRRRPGVLATFRPTYDRQISFVGDASDQAGQRELLRIARTLQVVK